MTTPSTVEKNESETACSNPCTAANNLNIVDDNDNQNIPSDNNSGCNNNMHDEEHVDEEEEEMEIILSSNSYDDDVFYDPEDDPFVFSDDDDIFDWERFPELLGNESSEKVTKNKKKNTCYPSKDINHTLQPSTSQTPVTTPSKEEGEMLVLSNIVAQKNRDKLILEMEMESLLENETCSVVENIIFPTGFWLNKRKADNVLNLARQIIRDNTDSKKRENNTAACCTHALNVENTVQHDKHKQFDKMELRANIQSPHARASSTLCRPHPYKRKKVMFFLRIYLFHYLYCTYFLCIYIYIY